MDKKETVKPVAQNKKAFHEYYILENRQKVNWDRSLGGMGHGLQVTHVDYNAESWMINMVNSVANHQRMTVISANNEYNGSTALQNGKCTQAEMVACWGGTLFPYVKDGVVVNDSLTAFSTPAATVYTRSGFMNQDLHAIHENADKSVTFYFGNDYVDGLTQPSAMPSLTSSPMYDLSGRPVTTSGSLRKGVYIQSGHKRLIR